MRNFFGGGNWVRDSEHIVLRLVSLAFSVGSAYAIRWFFEPLDVGDPIHYVLWWIVAAGFGLLGFYLSRSLTHRMMNKEPVWAYAPVFLLVEFFEVLCNYAKAVSSVAAGGVSWVVHAPPNQQGMMIILTYIGWSILPLVSPTMAVADMDMTRRRAGEIVNRPKMAPLPKQRAPLPGAAPAPKVPPLRQFGYQGGQNGVNPPPAGVSRQDS